MGSLDPECASSGDPAGTESGAGGRENSHPPGMEGKWGCVAHTSFTRTNSTSWSPRVTRQLVLHKVVQGSFTSSSPVDPETVSPVPLCLCTFSLV